MKKALKIISDKELGVLIIKSNKGSTIGIITDGDLKRIAQKHSKFETLLLKNVMKKNPIVVKEDSLAVEALSIMNTKKITALCVYKKNKYKTTGLLHLHNILNANIN